MLTSAKAKDWLVSSALSALWLAALWSVKTIVLDRPDSSTERSLAIEADLVQHSFIDSLVTSMGSRTQRFQSLFKPRADSLSPTPPFGDSASRILRELEKEVRADSTDLAAVLAFATNPEDRAFVAAMTEALSAEHRKWERIRALLERRPRITGGDIQAAFEALDDAELATTALMRSTRMYSKLHLERLRAESAALEQRARPVRIAIVVLGVALLCFAYLFQVANAKPTTAES